MAVVPSISESIHALDISLFASIETQLSDADRRSLLAVHAALRQAYGRFSYLEIGSHLGGSLQAVIRDPSCDAIVSIDSRPPAQPDERGFVYRYPANSTARMLEELRHLPDSDLTKLQTIDATTDQLDPATLSIVPQVCFVDGQHTDAAALGDARFCLAALGTEGCIAFHDSQVVYRGLRAFLDELQASSLPHRSYYLPTSLFVVEIGANRLIECNLFREVVIGNAEGYLDALGDNDMYREWYRRSVYHRARRFARKVVPARN
jgi:hypothetical protein